MTVIFLQHLISQVCISQQISVIVKIEFAHQITYEAPPRQNIFEGELPAEKSVHEKKSVLEYNRSGVNEDALKEYSK